MSKVSDGNGWFCDLLAFMLIAWLFYFNGCDRIDTLIDVKTREASQNIQEGKQLRKLILEIEQKKSYNQPEDNASSSMKF